MSKKKFIHLIISTFILSVVCVSTNTVFAEAIAGCNNGTLGFSIVSGVSCANNTAGAVIVKSQYDFGTATLRTGARGDSVKELQRYLNDKLHLGLKVDGVLGPKTILIIKEWQKNHDLTPDGVVGPKTKYLMNLLVN